MFVVCHLLGAPWLTLCRCVCAAISGPLPSSIKFLHYVQYFMAMDNQMTGSLSPGFTFTDNLQALNLANNKFDGPIPPTVGVAFGGCADAAGRPLTPVCWFVVCGLWFVVCGARSDLLAPGGLEAVPAGRQPAVVPHPEPRPHVLRADHLRMKPPPPPPTCARQMCKYDYVNSVSCRGTSCSRAPTSATARGSARPQILVRQKQCGGAGKTPSGACGAS